MRVLCETGLNDLQSVAGTFGVYGSGIEDLAGLDSLTSVDKLELIDLPQLVTVDGLTAGLASIPTGITFQALPAFSTSGISTTQLLNTVALNVIGCPNLRNLDIFLSFSNIARTALTDLPGLFRYRERCATETDVYAS